MRQLFAGNSLGLLFKPAVRTASAGGPDCDLGLVADEVMAILNCAAASVGTNPTADVKLQSSTPPAVGNLNNPGTGTVDIPLRNGTDDNIKLAYAWTQSGARQIKNVYLMLKRVGTIAPGKTVKVGIFTDNAGDPSVTQVGAYSASVAADALSTTYAWVKFTFDTPIDVAGATKYWIQLEGDYDVSAVNQVAWRVRTVATGGLLDIFDATWGGAVTTQKAAVYIEQYDFQDVPAGVFAQVTSASDSLQSLIVDSDQIGRFLRAYFAIGGSSNPSFTFGASVLGIRQYRT
jgi:hypothetical protein